MKRLLTVFFSCLVVLSFPIEAKTKGKNPPVGSIFSHNSAPPTVVIDAGHGGFDRGARSKAPFCEEKRLCLSTAKLVRKHLEQLGYKVVMTRSGDHYISLSRRVQIAKATDSAIFVSIHYNSARNKEAKGIEVFFCEGKSHPIRARHSKMLAENILPKIVQRTAAASRGVKKANFYVIRESTMPAVLIEGGFITNFMERAQLKTTAYQDRLARGVADGVDAYFRKIHKKPHGARKR